MLFRSTTSAGPVTARAVVLATGGRALPRSASSMSRVNWTPDGFIGELFKTIGKYIAPPVGLKSPALWGTKAHIAELFGDCASAIRTEAKEFMFRYRSDDHWIEVFRTYYGPVLKAFESLDGTARAALTQDLKAMIARFNTARDGTMVVPSTYLQVVIIKR